MAQNPSFFRKTIFTQADFNHFAELSGDDNPIHVDEAFSARTKFGKPVAHGMFLLSHFCAMLGSAYPGSAITQTELMFPQPTFSGEEVSLHADLQNQTPDEMKFSIELIRGDGARGLQGNLHLVTETRLSPSALTDMPQLSLTPSEAESHRGLSLGQTAEVNRRFTERDLNALASLVQDTNPLYTEPGYARRRGFKNVILPPGLLGGMISFLLGTVLPGRGTNWLKQTYYFPCPAYPEEALTARVTITRIRPEKDLVNLRTMVTNTAGTPVLDGIALVWVSDLERGHEKG